MKGKLIIIEGSDGSGKQTQSTLLAKNLNAKRVSFPNYDSPSSILVQMYLKGDFGKDPSKVNPYAISTLYAVDRYATFKIEFEEYYNNGGIVIADRYTVSNIIHQASKIHNLEEQKYFIEWIEDLEYNKIKIPKPDIVIYLNVPFSETEELMKDRKNKITGKKEKDIHEENKEYLKNCYENSIKIAKMRNWKIINCIENNNIRSVEDIQNEILEIVKEIL